MPNRGNNLILGSRKANSKENNFLYPESQQLEFDWLQIILLNSGTKQSIIITNNRPFSIRCK